MKRFSFLVLCLLSVHFGAFGADPDAKPKLTLAQAKAKFEEADKALNDAYAEAKKALVEKGVADLRDEQRNWVKWRDSLANSPMITGVPFDPDHENTSAAYFSAAADFSLDRAQWLFGLARQTLHVDEDISGRWADSYGGDLGIVEQDGRLYFVCGVVRGHSAHTGEISGIARWNRRIGWFSDKGRDKDKTHEANLSFVYKRPRLEIIEAGADAYHGANAHFDGEYVKVRPLSSKERQAILQAGKTGEVPGS